MIDLYCERLGPDFWAEPVNALTNLGFVLAAWLIWRFAVQKQVQDPGIAIVTGVIAAIGIGSFLFHTMATPLTRWLDVLPILVFQLMYIGLYARRVIALHWAVILSMLVIFLAAALYGRQFPEILNGSLIYAPALLVIAGLGIYHYRSRKKARGLLLVAATAFLLSVFFRSIDNAVCSQFALGTHFLWHIFNALVIYLVMRALLVNLVAE
jgi:hypothetical protein